MDYLSSQSIIQCVCIGAMPNWIIYFTFVSTWLYDCAILLSRNMSRYLSLSPLADANNMFPSTTVNACNSDATICNQERFRFTKVTSDLLWITSHSIVCKMVNCTKFDSIMQVIYIDKAKEWTKDRSLWDSIFHISNF